MVRGFSFVVMTALCTLAACGGSDNSSSGQGGGAVPCKGPTTDNDCVGQTTAKFDCSSADEQAAAKASGCVAEHPSDAKDFDVCCPAGTVSNRPTTVSCAGPTTDPDCTGAYPNKFDCTSESASSDAKSKGCVSEHPEDSKELDVCCPAGFTKD